MQVFGIILLVLVIIGLFVFLYFAFKSADESEKVKRLRDITITNYLNTLIDKENNK